MLEKTFLHLPGIGLRTERKLWDAGILSWDDLDAHYSPEPILFPEIRRNRKKEALEASQEALSRGDAGYFAERLPASEHYRIAATFPADTVFLDIETTGLSTYYDHITLVGLSRADHYKCFVLGTRDRAWQELLDGAKCLVTFNGKAFDLKFLAQEFPELSLPAAHVDLRFLGRRVALSGTQKSIEHQIGLNRPEAIEDVRGIEAVLLWYEYKGGSVEAGRRLVQYNHADVEGMKSILDAAISRLIEHDAAPPVTTNGVRFASLKSELRFAKSRRPVAKNRIYVPRFRGRKGPKVNYADLARIRSIDDLRIVGIDLTGSSRRPTGWCLLAGRRAETKLLRTDKEIIDATVNAAPDVVSIDSPLSLPIGRRSVKDTDRGRDKYGITRECERILKRRGVNVYPSLIPSMQGLTKRGISLAKKLRSRGIPVIESYPGAAQDIMSIPRKRASLYQLKQGLRHFGIAGDFSKKKTTHDEVDAVTSAVVGLFWWCGKFEALGNEAEDYLIIPDLTRNVEDWSNRRVVGISGPIAAGKTTAARHLADRGYFYGRYSIVLADMLRKKGLKPNRARLQEIGERVHRNPGQRWLNGELLKYVSEGQNLVIDGLRWPEDHAFWAERFGPAFFHVHVDAEHDTRKVRYIAEGGSKREFEMAVNHSVEHMALTLFRHADSLIANNKSIAGFKGNVTQAINRHYLGRTA